MVERQLVQNERYADETTRLLSALGHQQRLDYPSVLTGRDTQPDPDYAGTAHPAVTIAEAYLPLRSGPGRVRLYSAADTAPAPLLLWLHGGSFVGGSGRDLDAPCSAIAHLAECTVVSLDYRLAPEHPYPAALNDTYDALCWLVEYGRSIGGDGRVAIGGQSAGGNFAGAACLLARDRGMRLADAQVLCYPVLDFDRDTESVRHFNGVFLDATAAWPRHAYLAGQDPSAYSAPLRAESLADLPPALVIAAGRDPLRDDARDYAARLEDADASVRLLEYAATMHAFLNFSGVLSAAEHAVHEIAAYLVRTLPSSAPATAASLDAPGGYGT